MTSPRGYFQISYSMFARMSSDVQHAIITELLLNGRGPIARRLEEYVRDVTVHVCLGKGVSP